MKIDELKRISNDPPLVPNDLDQLEEDLKKLQDSDLLPPNPRKQPRPQQPPPKFGGPPPPPHLNQHPNNDYFDNDTNDLS